MTGPSMGPDAIGGSAVDRRWFEEALRSQGFVVEPPGLDDEPASATPIGEDALPVPTTPDGSTPERPPVPSALLARIASRGPVAPAAPDDSTGGSPVPPVGAPQVAGATAAAAERTVSTPWGEAVVATVAPWSTPAAAEGASPTPSGPTPGSAAAASGSPVLASHPAPEAIDGPATPSTSPDPAPSADGPGTPLPPPDLGPATTRTAQSLASPYVEPVVAIDAPAPPSSVVADAAEGELWALVGGAERPSAQATGADLLRVLLTVLTALVILLVVVGSLVLASQLA
ncbi:MAG: hypothetical protein R3C32_14165 [Chloroflexota bacterium]